MVIRYLIIISTFFLTACVGTIDTKKPEASETVKSSTPEVNYQGITSAIAVSHNKVDVFFKAGSLPAEKSKYLIQTNDNTAAMEVNGNRITPSLVRPGEYKITIDRLTPNTSYTFSVALMDTDTGIISNVNKKERVSTFSNVTADFNGILSVDPLEGVDGKTKIKIKWVPATIRGDVFALNPQDPVLYRIQYLDAEKGTASELANETNSEIKTILIKKTNGFQIENSIPLMNFDAFDTEVNKTETTVVTGLTPGKKYYFLVRVAHSDYITYRTQTGYKYEANLNVKAASTTDQTVGIDWNDLSVTSSVVVSDNTLTKRSINWAAATGPFDHYRVYVRNLGATPSATLQPDINGITTALNNNTSMPASGFGVIVNPANAYVQLNGLTGYNHYNIRVAVCFDVNCSNDASRIISPIHSFQVVPKIAPFFGIRSINDPVSSTTLNKISLSFESPVITSGFVTGLEVYCMPSAGANPITSSVLLNYNTASVSSDSKCSGLTRLTADPLDTSSFANFTKIEITSSLANPFLPAGSLISPNEYCFGIVPVIKYGSNYIHKDLANMVTKCNYIQKRMPTASDFPGVIKVCNPNSDNTLAVNWSKPKSGVYSGYTVFWKKNNGKPFLFTEAMTTAIVPPAGTFLAASDVYYKKIINNINTINTNINGLEAGSRYYYGILAHDEQAGTYTYSEINTNIQDCAIKLPMAQFDEWVDIMAIGPKENGMSEYSSVNGHRSEFISESLNEYGQPVELEVDSNGSLTDKAKSYYGPNSGRFNGISGKLNNNPLMPLHKHSNRGIIRIAWKDIKFSAGSLKLNDYIEANDKFAGSDPIIKKDRRYGYHVYRSHDNQGTWIKLTGVNDYQEEENEGLLHPQKYYEWDRTNSGYKSADSTISQAYFDGTKAFNAVTFTDYSVSASLRSSLNDADRARVYYYKVVPVINGSEIQFQQTSGVPQNIIKVVLPPPNMAYVSRIIANRQTCLELGPGHEPSKDVGTFYSCKYNGVGSTSLIKPTQANSSSLVYDIGKDFLIDRYELGCNVTRGSENPDLSTMSSAKLEDFTSAGFQGCAFIQDDTQTAAGYNPSTNVPTVIGKGLGQTTTVVADSNQLGAKYFRKGDCVSRSTKTLRTSTGAEYLNYPYPGFYGLRSDSINYGDFTDPYKDNITEFAAQSEYGAVHENIGTGTMYFGTRIKHQARHGEEDNKTRLSRFIYGASSCTINLPTITNGKMKPRWIPANALPNLNYEHEHPDTAVMHTTNFSITNRTIAWLKTLTANDVIPRDVSDDDAKEINYLYDDTQNQVPAVTAPSQLGRFNEQTKLGKIVSSNAAKLPPLTGLDHNAAGELCKTYEVEVGYEKNNIWTKIKNKKNKRPMRRTEGIIANAWPKMFVEGRAERLTIGGVVQPISPELNRPLIKDRPNGETLPLVDSVRMEQGLLHQAKSLPLSLTNPSDHFNASCLSFGGRAITQTDSTAIEPGSLMLPQYKISNTAARAILVSGSSIFDLDNDLNFSTQDCISRYGLQDIIGNVSEVSSDEIHCDSQAARDYAKIGLFSINGQSSADPRIDANGQIFRHDTMAAKGYVTNPAYEDIVGSCAVNSMGNDRDSADARARIFISGTETFKDLIDVWGRFTDLIAAAFRNEHDPGFVETLRDRSGYFLDFGRNKNIAAELRHGNELALYEVPPLVAQSTYFSPIIGIPLKCPEIVCGRETDPTKSDNLEIRTKTLSSGAGGSSFPIGNSQISSSGVLAIRLQDQWNINGEPNKYPPSNLSVIVSVYDEAGETKTATEVVDPSLAYGGSPYSVSRAVWSADLNYSFKFYNFGSATQVGAGRYGALIEAQAPNRSGAILAGTRCAVSLD